MVNSTFMNIAIERLDPESDYHFDVSDSNILHIIILLTIIIIIIIITIVIIVVIIIIIIITT